MYGRNCEIVKLNITNLEISLCMFVCLFIYERYGCHPCKFELLIFQIIH